MPTAPAEQIAFVCQIGLLLTGAALLLRLLLNPIRRIHWLGENRLPAWPLPPVEFVMLILLFLAGGYFFQVAAQAIFGSAIGQTTDRLGWKVVAYGASFDVGAIVIWVAFPFLQRYLRFDPGAATPAGAAIVPRRLPWSRVFAYGAATVLMAFPLLLVLNLGWLELLHRLGLPDEPQDLIAIFSNAKSPLVIAGLVLLACVVAPLYEELVFRAGLYRFCRARLGRGWSLAICGGLFGAVHLNLAGFLPLALLGAGLALAYEATGDIRVAVVAHGLFNLINTLFVFSGLSP